MVLTNAPPSSALPSALPSSATAKAPSNCACLSPVHRSAGSVVPFYLQPTLGGSNINGNPWLSSYSDYRFRAPNALLLREAFEHSIWGPIGFVFSADQGKVALARNGIDFNQLAHTFSVGLTLQAGGLPALSFAFAWGGPEGTHTIANVNTSLLGGSTPPSLF